MPMPSSAWPASLMIVRTSAKSRLIRPGSVTRSEMPCTPWRSTSSATRNASTIDVPFSSTDSRRLLGITISVSTCLASSATPSSAWRARRVPSKPNGLVTMPTVSAPTSRAIRATTGAAPVPVPPPEPAATNTMSEPFSRLLMRSSSVDRRGVADLRVGSRAEAARDLGADVERDVRGALLERLQVGVDGDELDALDARLDHPVDGVHAARRRRRPRAAPAGAPARGVMLRLVARAVLALRLAGALEHVVRDVVREGGAQALLRARHAAARSASAA